MAGQARLSSKAGRILNISAGRETLPKAVFARLYLSDGCFTEVTDDVIRVWAALGGEGFGWSVPS